MPTADRRRRAFLISLGRAAAGAALLGVRPRITWAGERRPRVLVLGAGLAGLRSALLLEDRGCDVTVLEGRSRLGGRLHSLYDVPGQPEEGGSILGRSYQRMLGLAERIDAPLATPAMGHGPKTGPCKACHTPGKVPDRRGGPGTLISWRGRLVREGDWIDALPELSERERSVAPDRLLASFLQAGNPLEDAEAWTRSGHAALDALSLEQYLAKLGATPVALEIMNVAPNCPGLAEASAVWALRDAQRRAAAIGGPPLEFPQGASAFVERLAESLGRRPLTGRVVRAIASQPERLVVECEDGSVHEADYGICTLPLPVLARLELDPAPEPDQGRAFREIRYTPITRLYFSVGRPFWEQDGLPITLWSDSVLERVFPLRDTAGEVVGLASHADGPAALRLDAMDPASRLRFGEQELGRIRPSTRGAVTAVASTSWGTDAFAGGAYPCYAPGQVGSLRPFLSRPLGRLHFAGEHTAVSQPGMEGAAESADRAVAEVLARVA